MWLAKWDQVVSNFFPELCWTCQQVPTHLLCPHCQQRELFHDDFFFTYEPWIQKKLWAIKFERDRQLAKRLGLWLSLHANVRVDGIDAAVPIPLSPQRLKKRGFNQVDLFFKPLMQALDIPWLPILYRNLDTPPLFELTPIQRKTALQGAFSCRIAGVAPRKILLLDDIFTTGATLLEASKSLKEAGITEIRPLTLTKVMIQ